MVEANDNDCDETLPSILDVDDIASSSNSNSLDNINVSSFSQEQQAEASLISAFRQARENKGGYLITDNLLYRKEKMCGRDLINIVVP